VDGSSKRSPVTWRTSARQLAESAARRWMALRDGQDHRSEDAPGRNGVPQTFALCDAQPGSFSNTGRQRRRRLAAHDGHNMLSVRVHVWGVVAVLAV